MNTRIAVMVFLFISCQQPLAVVDQRQEIESSTQASYEVVM